MTALYDRGDLENFLIVHADGGAMPPQFYSGSWKKYWTSDLSTDAANHRQVMCNSPRYTFPNYIVFSGDRLLGEACSGTNPSTLRWNTCNTFHPADGTACSLTSTPTTASNAC